MLSLRAPGIADVSLCTRNCMLQVPQPSEFADLKVPVFTGACAGAMFARDSDAESRESRAQRLRDTADELGITAEVAHESGDFATALARVVRDWPDHEAPDSFWLRRFEWCATASWWLASQLEADVFGKRVCHNDYIIYDIYDIDM